jgi:FixJ family two-component response regulator
MSDAKPIVFVIDDDASVRNSLALLVESAGWRAETFGSASEFLSRRLEAAPSCLVLDVFLPDLNGCDVQALLADRAEMPIVFISGQADVATSVRAMKAGAMEFITKPFDDKVIVGAIDCALDRSRRSQTAASAARELRDTYALLSPREREVMALVVSGRLNKQVGSDLGISEITVKAHRGKMMRKMNAGSICDLVRMAVKLQLSPGMHHSSPS